MRKLAVSTLATVAVSVSGLDINLDAGTYWISLTPESPTWQPQEFRYDSGSTINNPSLYRSPGGAFGLAAGTDWGPVNPDIVPGYGDAAITIIGTAVPEPASVVVIMLIGLTGLNRRLRFSR